MTESRPTQFSLSTLLKFMTLLGVGIGVTSLCTSLVIENRQLRSRLAEEEYNRRVLETEVQLEKGQWLRTDYGERLLFHVIASESKYPQLISALRNGAQQKVRFALHPLEKDDNLTFGKFYPLSSKEQDPQFAYSFLLQEKPFAILDYLPTETGKVPGFKDGTWYLNTQQNGEQVWYTIDDNKFVEIEIETD